MSATVLRGKQDILLAGLSIMAAPIKCPKGHWFTPDASGKATVCPHCKAQSRLQSGSSISEDDVLAILGPSKKADLSDLPSEEEPVPQEDLRSHALQRRRKVCPKCFYETSLAFGYCPRCGGPLEIALTEAF
jgi:hypothetical protein